MSIGDGFTGMSTTSIVPDYLKMFQQWAYFLSQIGKIIGTIQTEFFYGFHE